MCIDVFRFLMMALSMAFLSLQPSTVRPTSFRRHPLQGFRNAGITQPFSVATNHSPTLLLVPLQVNLFGCLAQEMVP